MMTQLANRSKTPVVNARSKCRPQERRMPLKSFHLSACESCSMRSRNGPFSITPPPKQAFIPKHLLTGCDPARPATVAMHIEWDGLQWRFHELCQSAVEQAHDVL